MDVMEDTEETHGDWLWGSLKRAAERKKDQTLFL